MINWFDMPAEGLSNGGLFEVKELEITENGTYEEKGEMYNKVTVNVEGGGGSSDFSTAQMTIAGNESSIGLTCAFIYEDSGETALNVSSGGMFIGEYVVPLYKGTAMAHLDFKEIGNVVVTGNATINEDGLIIITGDCTITLA